MIQRPRTTLSGEHVKTILICHEGAQLDQIVLAQWLGSFSDLVGVIVIHEPSSRLWQRMRREFKRGGVFRFIDVLAFRAYYFAFMAATDRRWLRNEVERLRSATRKSTSAPVLKTPSPNSLEAISFMQALQPDIVIARSKSLLKEEVFSVPRLGTFVMHPGICPEYRNAHGCFWALANRDLMHVGMTLLRIDKGVDTGPVFGYYSYPFDETRESHIVIQHRVVLENLDALRHKFLEIFNATAVPINTEGRPSANWGQPRLTKFVQWKYRAR